MPVHDWTRVEPGIFHAFHTWWIGDLSRALNAGLLPAGYYSFPEQSVGAFGPDVLTLHEPADPAGNGHPVGHSGGGVATLAAPVRPRFAQRFDPAAYKPRNRNATIRHVSDHRVVAVIEVVSPGNKSGEAEVGAFREKVLLGLQRGIHFLVIDLFPPTPRDPHGIHGLLAEACGEAALVPPPGQDRMLASYLATRPAEAFLAPLAVGEALPDMPLFLRDGQETAVPLEATYAQAWGGMPPFWRDVLERPAPPTSSP